MGDSKRSRGPAVEVHLERASAEEIDKQAAELRDIYEVYRSMRRTVRKPGDLSMRYDIRHGKETVQSRRGLSLSDLEAEAARYRILDGIRRHVEGIGDVASFDLAFDLSCKRRPEDIILPEVPDLDLPGGPQG